MPIANSQQRDALDQTVWQSRNTTIASLVCSQVLRVTESASIAADASTDLYLVDSTSASVTLTLPSLEFVPVGRRLAFYKLVAANSMIVDGYSSEQVEGAANQTRTAQYAFVVVEKVETAANTYAWALSKADVAAGEVGTTELADLAVTTAKIALDAIDGTLIGDDVIDSEHYVAGSIDNEHLAANSVNSDNYVDGSIDPEHFAAGAVVGATLGGGTRANTVDTAVVLDAADASTVVTISSTAGAGTRTITVGTLPVGALVMIVMTAFDTNAYTAAVQGGTVTFDAVGEAGLFFYDGTALRFIATGDGNPATFA